nr:spidroin-1-like [Aegilops tauschii subsp. strangulata]
MEENEEQHKDLAEIGGGGKSTLVYWIGICLGLELELTGVRRGEGGKAPEREELGEEGGGTGGRGVDGGEDGAGRRRARTRGGAGAARRRAAGTAAAAGIPRGRRSWAGRRAGRGRAAYGLGRALLGLSPGRGRWVAAVLTWRADTIEIGGGGKSTLVYWIGIWLGLELELAGVLRGEGGEAPEREELGEEGGGTGGRGVDGGEDGAGRGPAAALVRRGGGRPEQRRRRGSRAGGGAGPGGARGAVGRRTGSGGPSSGSPSRGRWVAAVLTWRAVSGWAQRRVRPAAADASGGGGVIC